MKTKQIELLLLSVAVLLAIGWTITKFTSADIATPAFMQYALAVGIALYVGYAYLTQMRSGRTIDGLEERNDELRHKVADREAKIGKLNKQVSGLEGQVSELEATITKNKNAFAKEKKAWEAEKNDLLEQIKSASESE